MLKNILLILLLFVPVFALAATNDFIANGNVTVSSVTFGAGTANMLILNGSTAASWNFSSGTFTVTDPGSMFQVGSSDSAVKSIQVSQSGTTLACSENTTPGTSAVILPTTAGTYTVSPSTTTQCTSLCTALSNAASYNSFPTCGAASCNAGYILSGSGASAVCAVVSRGSIALRSSLPPTPPNNGFTVTATPIQSSSNKILLHFGYGDGITEIVISDNTAFNSAMSIAAKPTSEWKTSPTGTWYVKYCNKYHVCSNPVSVSTSTSYLSTQRATDLSKGQGLSFTTTLRVGMQGRDVYRLQQLLATDKDIYPEGLVTGYYGPLTERAVQRFQSRYAIVSSGTPESTGFGLVGPKTRRKLGEVFGGAGSSALNNIPAYNETPIAIFNTNLTYGMRSHNVYRLQQLLATDKDIYPEGLVTGYFGPLTLKAVQRFQLKYGVVSSDVEAGYGTVGPKTRAKIKEIFK